MGQEDWGNCNGNGDRSYFDRVARTETATARRNGATATATAIDRSQWQWGTGAGATAIAMALGHRSRGNRTVIAMGQQGVGGDVYVVLQHKTSTIVVDETMQNVWTAIIPDVLGWNKTCMICSGIVFRVSYLYSKVELVNAFRINSSLKWSKLYSNRVSNIISECS
jgi:hypothetical protein